GGAACRALAAGGVTRAAGAGHAVAARLAGDAEAVDVLGRAGREALHAGAVGAARRHLQAAVDLAGPAAPADLVFDLGRALSACGDHTAGAAPYEPLLRPPAATSPAPGDLPPPARCPAPGFPRAGSLTPRPGCRRRCPWPPPPGPPSPPVPWSTTRCRPC